MATVHRRTFLATTGLAGMLALTGCTRDRPTEEGPMGDERITYGDDPSQYVEISRPDGTSRGVVVVIHGGFWKAAYDASLGRPLAASLRDEGWTAAEHGVPPGRQRRRRPADPRRRRRRDRRAGRRPRPRHTTASSPSATPPAVTSRSGRPRAAGSSVAAARSAVTAAVSQAGVLDLGAGYDDGLGGGAVEAFSVGARPRRRGSDPRRQLPLDVPVRCIHGTVDDIVPVSQSREYVEAAVAAGPDATLTEVDGDHFVLIDPASEAWTTTLGLLDDLV